jgi:uncharacterized protein
MNKMVLGTVQFGMDYGINNPTGMPSRKQSLNMLDFAWQKGVRIFDTAYNYGKAEEILGEFIKTRKLNSKIKIVTKLKPNILDANSDPVIITITKNLDESLHRLNINYVNGYLLHTPSYIYNKKVVSSLLDLKKQGLVKNIGVSIYDEEDALYSAKLKDVDYIQVPYSIFDQRLDKTQFFKIAKNNGKTIFARSAFLQGLLFMKEKRIPNHLQMAKPYFKRLDIILRKYDISRNQAALLFSYKNNYIDYLVFGVDNLSQLKENLEIVKKDININDLIRELKDSFVNIEKYIIFPSLWKK